MQHQYFFIYMLFLTAGSQIGCGSAHEKLSETVPVSGTVTYHGEPVSLGMIVLFPIDARMEHGGRTPMGEISKGTFRLTTFNLHDGAIPGRYKVVVESRTDGPTPENPTAKSNWIVPESFSKLETSPLEIEISRESKEIRFDL